MLSCFDKCFSGSYALLPLFWLPSLHPVYTKSYMCPLYLFVEKNRLFVLFIPDFLNIWKEIVVIASNIMYTFLSNLSCLVFS
jgi:hypothetical protein